MTRDEVLAARKQAEDDNRIYRSKHYKPRTKRAEHEQDIEADAVIHQSRIAKIRAVKPSFPHKGGRVPEWVLDRLGLD